MGVVVQLDFFKTHEESEIDALKAEVSKLRESQDKVRKAMFARHGELYKRQIDFEERLSCLERGICKKDAVLETDLFKILYH